MMLRWFPWKYVISRVARARGFVDPVKVLSRLESFAQPMEVKEPIELLRAGMVFHARGLLNSAVIQHNLDWIWPFWVQQQYDPRSPSFIPRAFSITHVNLTHRNWTAVGTPGCDTLPLVDPRGLVTPFWDSWSLDAWLVDDDGRELIPSHFQSVDQQVHLERGFEISTECDEGDRRLFRRAGVEVEGGSPRLRLLHEAQSATGGWLVISLRPYNPEGVSFVHHIAKLDGGMAWLVEGHDRLDFLEVPEAHRFSDYRRGDVRHELLDEDCEDDQVRCRVGMATAAALYRLAPATPRRVEIIVPLKTKRRGATLPPSSWRRALDGCARLEVPDPRFRFLYDVALRTLVLHSPGEVYPGPFTYKRFWFRDAAFILAGLLAAGLPDRVEPILDRFPGRQTRRGHFFSQELEWDSNGEALWILERFCSHMGRQPKTSWRRAVERGLRWIADKRLPNDSESPHGGLLPAGFSAEHLGPNDYYYWDDFWSIAGLRSGAALLEAYGDEPRGHSYRTEADDLEQAVSRSLATAAQGLGREAMPASPYRRLDTGAIGSLAAGYPLQLWQPTDPRLVDSAAYLLENCFVQGGFFQDMIHSGINPYLTLHVAQVLLRAGDPRAADLATTVARLASPTGQWPEAIHPLTGGGCMGDGQHAWAAAEWVLFLRNSFVREEEKGLVLGSGLHPSWLETGEVLSFGPTPTPYGPITVYAQTGEEGVEVWWQGDWRQGAPSILVQLPGRETAEPAANDNRIVIARETVLA